LSVSKKYITYTTFDLHTSGERQTMTIL